MGRERNGRRRAAIPPRAAGRPGAGGLARGPLRVSLRARAPRCPRRVQPRADASHRSRSAGPRSELRAKSARGMRSRHTGPGGIAQGVLLAPRHQRARSALTSWSCRPSERRGVVREGAPARSFFYQLERTHSPLEWNSTQIRAERPLGAGRTARGPPRRRTDGPRGARPQAADLPWRGLSALG